MTLVKRVLQENKVEGECLGVVCCEARVVGRGVVGIEEGGHTNIRNADYWV